MGKYVDSLNQKIQLTDKKRYRREQYQSFMTGPEWRNVEMAEEFTQFLRDGKSMFQYPYFRQISDLWGVFFNSYSAARKYNSRSEIFFSEYMLMDLFVVVFTTLELIPKGLISLILYPFLKKENNSEMQQHFADYLQKYAADLQTIPFYDHNYHEIRVDLAEKYKQYQNRTWVDWFSWKMISAELFTKKWVSKPLKYWFHQEGNEAPPATDILVKFDAIDVTDPEEAKRIFSERLAEIAKDHNVNLVDDTLYVKDHKTKKGVTYTSVYARLEAPRYAAFQPVVCALGQQEIHLRKIAGQDRVQVKCTIDAQDADSLLAKKEDLNKTKKVEALYTYKDRINPNHEICLFDVPIRNLDKTLQRMQKQEGVQAGFIHNF
ncbi:MAG: hypothetical protein P4L65_02705 [Legionella sp.]|nr:hypothetical protein [Legionella sp.]